MMKISHLWRSAARRLAAAGHAIDRFFDPLPRIEPGAATFASDLYLDASYGRFVLSMHAFAPRAASLCQAEVHEAMQGLQVKQKEWPARHPGELL